MINFFRKARKQLADDNKPIKYMRYAIGEIFLVVIGILIALQVNNWNEERKEKVIEQNYLKRLYNDIQKDINALSFSKGLTEIRFNQISLLIDVINNNEISNKNSKKIIEAIEKVTWRSYLPLSRITYNELLSSGKMSLIQSEDLREQLSIYYSNIDNWEIVLGSSEYQKEFVRETTGLLSIEMLKAIEKSEPLGKNLFSQDLVLEIDKKEVERIVKELSTKNGAEKWLPQIYHYHIFAAKVINQIEEQSKILLKSIEVEMANRIL